MGAMIYDVGAVRAHFPALAAGAAHFDAPGGTQTPDVVAKAVADTLTAPIANRGSVTAAENAVPLSPISSAPTPAAWSSDAAPPP